MNKIYIISLIVACILLSVNASSQIQKSTEGIYKDKNGNSYNGVYKEYDKNGQLKVEMNLKNGLKHGKVNVYYKNGNIHETYSYKKGLMDGLWLSYNSANIKTAEAYYLKDKKHGTWKIWNDNGNLIYIMQYKKGKKTGTWIKYDSEGKEIARKEY